MLNNKLLNKRNTKLCNNDIYLTVKRSTETLRNTEMETILNKNSTLTNIWDMFKAFGLFVGKSLMFLGSMIKKLLLLGNKLLFVGISVYSMIHYNETIITIIYDK